MIGSAFWGFCVEEMRSIRPWSWDLPGVRVGMQGPQATVGKRGWAWSEAGPEGRATAHTQREKGRPGGQSTGVPGATATASGRGVGATTESQPLGCTDAGSLGD